MLNLSWVKHSETSARGHKRIDWVSRHMPILNYIRELYRPTKPLSGLKVAVCLHLEAKTASFATVLMDCGADVYICGSNPLTTQDDCASALAERGAKVFAWRNATSSEYQAHIDRVLDHNPNLIIDDGADLVSRIHSARRDLIPNIMGGAEETTTGIHRLKALSDSGELGFPMIAVNDSPMKNHFDNRFGTAQSTIDGFFRATSMSITGKTVVIAGYGWCGQGLASRAKGFGAQVIICEVDPVKANEALMEGFQVMPMIEAAKLGDLFITVTGCNKVIVKEHFEVMKDGAVVMNSGHFDCEVYLPDLEELAQQTVELKENVREYQLADNKSIIVLAQGRLINLVAADGHPSEIIDLSLSLQILSILYVLNHHHQLGNKLIQVPKEIDNQVAELRLKALGVQIDQLSDEQKAYLSSWTAPVHQA